MLCRKCRRELPGDAIYCCYCGVKQSIDRKTKAKGNGLGSVYKRADRDCWCAAVTSSMLSCDGKLIQRRSVKSGFKTKKAAAEYLASVIAGNEARHTKLVPTVAELYQQYVDSPGQEARHFHPDCLQGCIQQAHCPCLRGS